MFNNRSIIPLIIIIIVGRLLIFWKHIQNKYPNIIIIAFLLYNCIVLSRSISQNPKPYATFAADFFIYYFRFSPWLPPKHCSGGWMIVALISFNHNMIPKSSTSKQMHDQFRMSSWNCSPIFLWRKAFMVLLHPVALWYSLTTIELCKLVSLMFKYMMLMNLWFLIKKKCEDGKKDNIWSYISWHASLRSILRF